MPLEIVKPAQRVKDTVLEQCLPSHVGSLIQALYNLIFHIPATVIWSHMCVLIYIDRFRARTHNVKAISVNQAHTHCRPLTMHPPGFVTSRTSVSNPLYVVSIINGQAKASSMASLISAKVGHVVFLYSLVLPDRFFAQGVYHFQYKRPLEKESGTIHSTISF